MVDTNRATGDLPDSPWPVGISPSPAQRTESPSFIGKKKKMDDTNRPFPISGWTIFTSLYQWGTSGMGPLHQHSTRTLSTDRPMTIHHPGTSPLRQVTAPSQHQLCSLNILLCIKIYTATIPYTIFVY